MPTPLLALIVFATPQATAEPSFAPSVWGLEREVRDGETCARVYEALGFERRSVVGSSRSIVLAQGDFHLVLRPVEKPRPGEGSAGWTVNVRVADLAAAREGARAAGAEVSDTEPKPFALGAFVALRDPSGHAVHLLDLADDEPPSAPRLFNLGCDLVDWGSAERTFADLGCAVFSREFLPSALPLERAGAVALVLHASASTPVDVQGAGERLLLAVPDLGEAREALVGRGFSLPEVPFACGPLGRTLSFRGAAGIGLALVERSPAFLAFERMRSLAGRWTGTSSEGWTSDIHYDVIAGGSVVQQTTLFEAHPGQAMVTLAHMDGPDLVLEHFCVAGNQPELVLASASPDGSELRFAFRRATNLASRDQGHMDSAVLRFAGPDSFSEAWTWYQDGAERWLEEVSYARLGPEEERRAGELSSPTVR